MQQLHVLIAFAHQFVIHFTMDKNKNNSVLPMPPESEWH